jgi:hypothetical protein
MIKKIEYYLWRFCKSYYLKREEKYTGLLGKVFHIHHEIGDMDYIIRKIKSISDQVASADIRLGKLRKLVDEATTFQDNASFSLFHLLRDLEKDLAGKYSPIPSKDESRNDQLH